MIRDPGEAWLIGGALEVLATVELLEGHDEEAARSIEAALRRGEFAYGAGHPHIVLPLRLQSCILRAAGEDAGAQEAAARADEIVRRNPAWFARANVPPFPPRLADACRARGLQRGQLRPRASRGAPLPDPG